MTGTHDDYKLYQGLRDIKALLVEIRDLLARAALSTQDAAVVEESLGRPEESGRATGTGGTEPSATAAQSDPRSSQEAPKA